MNRVHLELADFNMWFIGEMFDQPRGGSAFRTGYLNFIDNVSSMKERDQNVIFEMKIKMYTTATTF